MDARSYEDVPITDADESIPRGSTGLRILLTILFAVIWGVTETVLALAVAFSLLWTLITQRPPPRELRQFSNRLVAYAYRIWRYMIYAEPELPFPFSEFPPAIESTREIGADEAVELREHLPDRSVERELDLD